MRAAVEADAGDAGDAELDGQDVACCHRDSRPARGTRRLPNCRECPGIKGRGVEGGASYHRHIVFLLVISLLLKIAISGHHHGLAADTPATTAPIRPSLSTPPPAPPLRGRRTRAGLAPPLHQTQRRIRRSPTHRRPAPRCACLSFSRRPAACALLQRIDDALARDQRSGWLLFLYERRPISSKAASRPGLTATRAESPATRRGTATPPRTMRDRPRIHQPDRHVARLQRARRGDAGTAPSVLRWISRRLRAWCPLVDQRPEVHACRAATVNLVDDRGGAVAQG